MDNRTNTIAGWVLAGCAAALGLGIASSMVFHTGELEKKGYPIEGVEETTEGGPAAAAEPPIEMMMASADVTAGGEVFKKCTACHSVAQGGANGIGPNLYATVGEAIAEGKAGYAFSDALKQVGGTWTFAALNEWLKSPRKYAAGTKMSFAGLSSAEDRANVIAYLNAQGSNIPLPAAPVQEAATPGAESENNGKVPQAEEVGGDNAVLSANAPSNDPAAKKQ